jgi:hypothetical protein
VTARKYDQFHTVLGKDLRSVRRRSKTASAVNGNFSAVEGHASRRQSTEELAVELYTLVRLALAEFGVTRAQQRRALERAGRLKSPPNVSGRMQRAQLGIGEILLEWSRKTPYLDSEGKPRVLSIAGTGATFESLARRVLPNVSLKDVVALACANAEVVIRPGNRIALLGSILVKPEDTREKYLAYAIRQIDQMLQTSLHNWNVQRQGTKSGRMERMVVGVISRANFKAFMSELRPQIYDLLLRVDSSIERHKPKSLRGLRSASAVSVSVNVGQEDDFERAGVDASLAMIAGKRAELKRRAKPRKKD